MYPNFNIPRKVLQQLRSNEDTPLGNLRSFDMINNAQLAYASLHELDSEIGDLTTIIGHYEELRDSASRLFSAHISFLAPVRRIPLEVLSEIFQLCCSQGINFIVYSSEGFPVYAPVLVLGTVCRFWRTVILEQRSFWNTIIIPLSRTTDSDEDEGRLWLLKLVLERSYPLPLHLTVLPSYFGDTVFLDPLLDHLVDCSDRWKSVVSPNIHPTWTSVTRASNLESLTLSASYMSLYKTADSLQLPALTSLVLRGSVFDVNDLDIIGPSLRSFRLIPDGRRIPTTDVRCVARVHRQAPLLETLHVTQLQQPHFPQSTCSFLHLQHLDLGEGSFFETTGLPPIIHAPKLHSLTLSTHKFSSNATFPISLTTSVKKLHLSCRRAQGIKSFMTVCKSLPNSVVHLELEWSYRLPLVPDSGYSVLLTFLREIIVGHGDEAVPLYPQLQTVSLLFPGMDFGEAILEMLEHRVSSDAVRPLERFSFSGPYLRMILEPYIFGLRLRKLQNTGLTIIWNGEYMPLELGEDDLEDWATNGLWNYSS